MGRPQHFEPWLANSLLLAVIPLVALTIGVLVYVLDRSSDSFYFLTHALSFASGHRPYSDALGQLPDFVHVYAFILLTAAVSPRQLWVLLNIRLIRQGENKHVSFK
jgi:hypothetical protein